jgi:hypothetical protein
LFGCSASQRVSNQWIQSVDWLPTFAEAAGINLDNNTSLCGVSQWQSLKNAAPYPRSEVFISFDDKIKRRYNSLIDNDGWKVIDEALKLENFAIKAAFSKKSSENSWNGQIDQNEGQQSPNDYIEQVLSSEAGQILATECPDRVDFNRLRQQATVSCQQTRRSKNGCNTFRAPCLFNVLSDPCEYINLADQYPEKLKELEVKLKFYTRQTVPARNKNADTRSDPKHFHNTWNWWE